MLLPAFAVSSSAAQVILQGVHRKTANQDHSHFTCPQRTGPKVAMRLFHSRRGMGHAVTASRVIACDRAM
jgi:hypothetical protein